MSDRPPEYAGLPAIDKAVFELKQIGETLECILCLLEIETTSEPEPEVIEVAEPKRLGLLERFRRDKG